MNTGENKDRAIVIGINNYTNYYGRFDSLKHAVNDAYEIRRFLEIKIGVKYIYYFTDNCPEFPTKEEEKIGGKTISRMLLRPTYVNLSCFLLYNNFEESFSDCPGKIWFFFSGHGQIINNKEYLMPSDSMNNDSAYALDVSLIADKLRDSGACDIIMFIDACRTKSVTKGKSIEPKSQRGVVIFRSCDRNQQSFENSNINHGLFTKALLDGLNNQIDNCATVERLDKYLQSRVHYLLKDLEIYGSQIPCLRVEPAIKQKLILLEEIAFEEDIKKYPKVTRSRLYLLANRIVMLIKKYKTKYKIKLSISYLTIGLSTIIFCLLFSSPVVYNGVIKLMIGGQQISWEDPNPKFPNTLNSRFEWYPGTNKKNSFQVLSKNTLRINASPETEYWRKVSKTDNLPPVISFPIDRDFEATVKVTLNSTITFQRAYFGVRDSKIKYRQILIYLLENSRIEAAYVDEDVPLGQEEDNTYMLTKPPINLKNSPDTAYFRIRKHQNNFKLFYSEDGIQWMLASNVPSNSLPHEYGKCELFFTVISNSKYNSAIADFSDLSIKYLQ